MSPLFLHSPLTPEAVAVETLSDTLNWVGYYLPHQGTLQHFVHHNPLGAFENYGFETACEIGGLLYKGRCFLEQDRYLELLKAKKISKKQLQASVRKRLPEAGQGFQDLCFAFLCDPPRLKTPLLIEKAIQKKTQVYPHYTAWVHELQPMIAKIPIPDAHWDTHLYTTHAAFLLSDQGIDIDDIINPMLAKFLSTYSDPGSAYWKNEAYTQGLWACFRENYVSGVWLENHWAQNIRQELKTNPHVSDTVESNILYYLNKLGVPPAKHGVYLLNLALRLKGWASFFNQLEHHPEESLDDTVYRLKDFLLIKLVFEYVIVQQHVEPLTLSLPAIFEAQKSAYKATLRLQQLWDCLCFFEQQGQISQEAWRVSPEEKWSAVQGISMLSYDHRLFLYQQALDNTFTEQKISDLYAHNRKRLRQRDRSKRKATTPSFQYVTCIDDREESLRRHIEFADSRCQTFGIAGHFEMNMQFKAFNEVRFRKLCPGGIAQTFNVVQRVNTSQHHKNSRMYAMLYRAYAWQTRVSIGAFLTPLLTGVFAIFPLVFKLFFPGLDLALRQQMKRWFVPATLPVDLVFHAEGNADGISYEEGADKVAQLFKTIGLLHHFAPFVLMVGHGSSSVNNPHEYGYNCGACGGGKGMANARVFAKIANHPQVRKILQQKHGLYVPEDTCFVGGYHDTCNDSILWFDQHLSPAQTSAFENLHTVFKTALEQNMLERSQKFHNITADMSPQRVIQKVKARVNQISEARPEYNHATNALCIMGRRDLTRALSLERKSFLCSYDPALDDHGQELARLMSTAVPVCAGINLEYYFSSTDTEVFGCGSKLNHNIVNNYAVMSGFASDLRLGLSRQMVEIHLPRRMTFIIESAPEVLLTLLEENPKIRQLFLNDWAQLWLVSESFETCYHFDGGVFVRVEQQEVLL
jgi:uncharacterized protein